MRLVTFTIENFRAYHQPTTIHFDELTTIIGRNDVGKSCVLDALEIFFNNDAVKIDQADANVFSGKSEIRLTAEFADIPAKVSIDSGAETSIAAEFLLNARGNLEIARVYDCAKKACPCETYIVAEHPQVAGLANLLEMKERELQELVRARNLNVPLKGNPGMRHALWSAQADLKVARTQIPVSRQKEDAKRIWEQVEAHLPIYALFQSDRQSRDSDGEIQNPLKGAIATAIAEAQEEIDRIQDKVRSKSEEIARMTHIALQAIDPRLAGSLKPKFTAPTAAKWTGLFSLGMETDDNISLNKRGSGVRRLILVSFFKAEAERKLKSSSRANIIYAIEEPETSQHPANQRILIDAFKELATSPNCQVILTTHSPGLAADLPTESVRFVSSEGPPATPIIERGTEVFGRVADTLGLVPDSRVKLLICVEGPTDVEALRRLSRCLHAVDQNVPDLMADDRCAFVVLGGSTLKHWVTENYLKAMRRPEAHIYDSDVARYGASVAEVNARKDGLGSWATQTHKHEIECYLHPDAIHEAFGIQVEVCDLPNAFQPSVPKAFALAFSAVKKFDGVMGEQKAKQYLTRAFTFMTAARLDERDPQGEVRGWLSRIAGLL
jgi:putative ATP-dependent endonuclease of OLD family